MTGRESRETRDRTDRGDRGDRGDRTERQERADRAARAQAAARTNEYFVPKDGIDREVITADICRYLGNDALVRPGVYQNPQTGQAQSGFLITAYRNLTSAMMADLKADSDRWNEERRMTASSGARSSTAEYRLSTIHQSRQYYGPTEGPAPPPGVPVTQAAAPGYGPPAGGQAQQQGVYDTQYGGQQYAQQSGGNFIMPAQQGPQYPIQQDTNNYSYGVEYGVQDPSVDSSRMRGTNPHQVQSGTVPRNNGYPGQNPSYPPVDSRTNYSPYSPQSQQVPVTSAQYGQQPSTTDPYYGRAVQVGGQVYESAEYPNRGYPEQQVNYTTASVPSGSTPTVTAGPPSRRERDRDSRENRHRHDPRR